MQKICLMGATGSIGKSALEVLRLHPERFSLEAVTANSNVEALARIAKDAGVKVAAVADASKKDALFSALKEIKAGHIEVLAGSDALVSLAGDSVFDTVIQSIVGAAGVAPSFAAAAAGKKLLLANKESVVCGGDLLIQTARRAGAEILPVDSEHNAIFQCLTVASEKDREGCRLWLTCSGGPFRDKPDLDLSTVTPGMAVSHPTWSMGQKISVDSATLMNKGLEVIEAHYLFGIPADRISVVIHPQSIVHSMVEYSDGSFVAQMGRPSMKHPIAYCLGWPERIESGTEHLKPWELPALTFSKPDTDRFIQLGLAYEALREGGASCIVLNAANEIGVEAFLARRLSFTGIGELCRRMLERSGFEAPSTLEDIIECDRLARERSCAMLLEFD